MQWLRVFSRARDSLISVLYDIADESLIRQSVRLQNLFDSGFGVRDLPHHWRTILSADLLPFSWRIRHEGLKFVIPKDECDLQQRVRVKELSGYACNEVSVAGYCELMLQWQFQVSRHFHPV